MMMQVLTVCGVGVMPNLTRRSMTGTTPPRTLITPRMKSGVLGTLVMA
jgi:hypothetical protein